MDEHKSEQQSRVVFFFFFLEIKFLRTWFFTVRYYNDDEMMMLMAHNQTIRYIFDIETIRYGTVQFECLWQNVNNFF